ncbi:hypothetical protein EG19_07770 [Thermoanaerobaculum aquaticum]|uniref:Transport permease protein n=1 Tax=Thermoanaerobaculum aquaticum TaxID=1312852 RepID=A0A062XUP0_9BACT|nr:ABC transporter permease [Thermoanaerobaculum aquaticum]KDA53094.1 hypothetical protein EG19_07770 [Thermoanaerobaculum aquaticum]
MAFVGTSERQSSHRSTPGSQLTPWQVLRNLWRYRQLIYQLTVREIRQRTRGSFLDLLWFVLTPLLVMTVYTLAFSWVLKVRWDSAGTPGAPGSYALILFSGLIPFNVLADIFARGPTLVLREPGFVKRVRFPLEVLPVVAVAATLFQSLVYALVLLAADLLLRNQVSSTVLLLPMTYIPLVLLSLAIGWFLGSVGVYVRDIGAFSGLLPQLLFFLTPIAFPLSAVPESLRVVFLMNPLTTIVEDFRGVILFGKALPWGRWVVLTGSSAVFAWLGYVWFAKTKKGFAEVL